MTGSKSKMNRRQFGLGASALMTLPMVGCGKQEPRSSRNNESAVTVFENGVILPVDSGFSQHEAIAIAGNRILAVGTSESVRAAAKRINNVTDGLLVRIPSAF